MESKNQKDTEVGELEIVENSDKVVNDFEMDENLESCMERLEKKAEETKVVSDVQVQIEKPKIRGRSSLERALEKANDEVLANVQMRASNTPRDINDQIVVVFDKKDRFSKFFLRGTCTLCAIVGLSTGAYCIGDVVKTENVKNDYLTQISNKIVEDCNDYNSFEMKSLKIESIPIDSKNTSFLTLQGRAVSMEGKTFDRTEVVYKISDFDNAYLKECLGLIDVDASGVNVKDVKGAKKMEFFLKSIYEVLQNSTLHMKTNLSNVPVANKDNSIVLSVSRPTVEGDNVSYAVETLTLDRKTNMALTQQYIVSYPANDELKKHPEKVFANDSKKAMVEVASEIVTKMDGYKIFDFNNNNENEMV